MKFLRSLAILMLMICNVFGQDTTSLTNSDKSGHRRASYHFEPKFSQILDYNIHYLLSSGKTGLIYAFANDKPKYFNTRPLEYTNYSQTKLPEYKRWLNQFSEPRSSSKVLLINTDELNRPGTNKTQISVSAISIQSDWKKHPLIVKGNYLMDNDLIYIGGKKFRIFFPFMSIADFSPEHDLLLTITSRTKLSGILMSNGQQAWQIQLDLNREGWNDLRFINDSLLILSKSGLHFINTKTGAKIYQPASTSDTKYKYPLGHLSRSASEMERNKYNGVWYYFSDEFYSSEREWGLSSNICFDSASIYSIMSGNLSAYSMNGKRKWSTPVVGFSATDLHLCDSTIIVISKGYSITPKQEGTLGNMRNNSGMGAKRLYSEPGISIISRVTGKIIHEQKLAGNNDLIADYKIFPEQAILQSATRNKVIITCLKTGKQLSTREFGSIGETDVLALGHTSLWVKFDDESFINVGSNSMYVPLFINKNVLWLLDQELNTIKKFQKNEFFLYIGEFEENTLLKSWNEVVIVDSTGKPSTNLSYSGYACYDGKHLFIGDKNEIIGYEIIKGGE